MPQHVVIEAPPLTLQVPASLDAPALARELVVESAAPRLDPQQLDDARLLVSEVVTNAVRHAGLSTADEITVQVLEKDAGVLVEVTDPGRGFDPAPRPEPTGIGGWGLPLVEQLSDGWGVASRSGGGSVVWFRIGPRG